MFKKFLSLSLSALLAFTLVACAGSGNQTTSTAVSDEAAAETEANSGVTTKVALITMDQMDVHWVRLKEAAESRVRKYNSEGNNITMTWLAPEIKDNQQQIEKIQNAISDQAKYIIIAANDATSANNALKEAKDAGIKIIYVDSPATEAGSATYATDNRQGGVQAGQYLLDVLTKEGVTEGEIGIVDAQAGVDSCQKRYEGFASVFEGTNFTLGERQYSDGDNSKAQELANTLIANGVVAIYGTNDGATNGSAAAVADAKNNGKTVYCVGWDKSDSNIAHVEGGELLAFMAQNPNIMGEMAIDAVVKMEKGENLGGAVEDTGVSTVDASNVASFK